MELVPFLTLPVIFVLDRLNTTAMRLGALALVGMSAVNTWGETIGGRAFATGPVPDPLFTFSLPQLARGHVPLNLGTFIGLSGLATLAPLALAIMLWSIGMFNSQRLMLNVEPATMRSSGEAASSR